MKKILLFISLFVFSKGFTQTFNFDGGINPGFLYGQGISVGAYDNPDLNGCGGAGGNFTDDYGLITPGVGGNNPANFSTPELTYGGGGFINYLFKVYVFNSNLNCTSNKAFDCATSAQAYIVAPSFNSNTAPTGSQIIAQTPLVLVTGFGIVNNLFFTLTPAQITYLSANPTFRIYLDLQNTGNCNQNNTKYVFDNIRVVFTEDAPLPVHFKAFNASRTTTSNVSLSWTTAMEQNNKGFNIQKNVSGEWKTIAFVPSKAREGNSSTDLSYNYSDINTEIGITQYRVQQVDLDGKVAYTDIRAIRGESAASKIVVYPNPSVDGKLNVVFEDNSGVRDVQVADMQGRIVKSFKGITNNILVIEKLTSGFYTIKVTNRNTAASTVEKVVVK